MTWKTIYTGATNCANLIKDYESLIYDNEPVKVCQPEKHFCSYCQSNSIDDMRGNCCCCGAPRWNDNAHFRYAMNDGLVSAEMARTWLGITVDYEPR